MVLEELVIDYWMQTKEHNQLRIRVCPMAFELSEVEIIRFHDDTKISTMARVHQIPWSARDINQMMNDILREAAEKLLQK